MLVNREINEEPVDYRFLTADVDSCQMKALAEQSIVEMVLFNDLFPQDFDVIDEGDAGSEAAAASAAAARNLRPSRHTPRGQASKPMGNSTLGKRVVPAQFNNYQQSLGLEDAPGNLVAASPMHLNWLTAPGANFGLHPGTCV